jgi:MoxR-like ATPase
VWLHGETFATPDHVQALVRVILGHRLIIQGGPRQHVLYERSRVVQEILDDIVAKVAVPVENVS